MIKVENLHKSFGELEVLKGVMREAEYVKFASYARDESNLDKEWAEKQKSQNN